MVLMEHPFEEQIFYAIISIIISSVIYLTFKISLEKIFEDLADIRKLVKLIAILITVGELVYLGHDFGLFTIAGEIIASMGVAFGLLSIAFQSYLRNIAAGLGNYLKNDLNVGDRVDVSGKTGVIVEMGLTQTILMQPDGSRIFIPNLQFAEKEYQIFRKKEPCEHLNKIKSIPSPKSDTCLACQKSESKWVSLRMCLTCGNVGCDRTSVNRHAEKHFKETGHPMMIELPDQKWKWCFVHHSYF